MSMEQMFEELIHQSLHEATTNLSEEQIGQALEESVFADAIADTVPVIAEVLVDALFQAAPDMLAERSGPEATTREQIRRVFGPGLDICEMLLRIASEMGEEFTDEEFGDGDSIPIVPYTLGHLLARTCRIAEETL